MLKIVQFANNNECLEGDRLHKMNNFVKLLVTSYQSLHTPGEVMCVEWKRINGFIYRQTIDETVQQAKTT